MHDLVRMFDHSDPACQPYVCGWVLADLVDAAVHGDGDLDLVRGVLTEWEEVAADTTAPHLQVQLTYAAGLLADSATAEQRFQVAMASVTRLAVLHRADAARVRPLAAPAAPRGGFAHAASRGCADLRRLRTATLRRPRAAASCVPLASARVVAFPRPGPS